MSEDDFEDDRISFYHAEGFHASAPSAGLQLGPMELQYQELFAEVLEDGVITAEERIRLERAANNLGLDAERLARLEQAMKAAYETHHRIRVLDHSVKPHISLTPLRKAPPLSRRSSTASTSVETASSAAISISESPELERLRAENNELKSRVFELEDELKRMQATVNVEVDLSSLDIEAGSVDTPEQAWKRVRLDPTNVQAVRDLRDAFDANHDLDGKYLASSVLFVLGATEPDEAAFVQAHRPTQLIAPRRSMSADLWQNCLIHPEEEASTGAIFSLVAPAILVGRVTTLRRDGQLHVPDPTSLADPVASTVMAVRALSWAATLLGLPVPKAYLEPERTCGYKHLAGIPPITVLGSNVLRGKSALEVAFLVGRHLTGYRGEHFVPTLFPGIEDQEELFLAALLVANHRLPINGTKGERVQALARSIGPLLDVAAGDKLKRAYLAFAEEGGRTNLQRFSQATQFTAGRVGLALCQDLCVARDLLVPDEGKLGPLFLDLLSYCTSQKFRTLRAELGVAISASSV